MEVYKLEYQDGNGDLDRRKALDDTIAHFNSTNRSENERGSCRYRGPNGLRCAVARLVTDEMLDKLEENSTPNDYKEFGGDSGFLEALQGLHDGSQYWDAEGLSRIGEEDAQHIRDTYDLGGADA